MLWWNLLLLKMPRYSRIRVKAAEKLGKYKRGLAAKALVAALKDRDYYVSNSAATALGKIGETAVEPLVAAIKDSNGYARRRAAKVLLSLQWQPTTDSERAVLAVINQEWDEVVRLGTAAVEPLLAEIGGDSDWQIRERAAKALGKIGDARAVKPLVTLLSDSRVRRSAAEALGNIREAAVQPLVEALKNGDRHVRRLAAEELGKIGDARAIKPLVATLKDNDRDMRVLAATALVKIGEAAVEPLVAVLKDSDSHVRQLAAKALHALKWQPANDSERAVLAVANQKWDEAVRLGSAAVEPLLAVHEDYGGLGEAVRALVKIGEAAVEPLVVSLKNSDSHVRGRAAEALGKIGDARAVEPLAAALTDSDSHVQGSAAEALGKIGNVRTVEPLVAALNDTNIVVRRHAVVALGEIGDARATMPLIAALEQGEDKDGWVRSAIAEALGKVGDTRAIKPLLTMLEQGGGGLGFSVRSASAAALWKIGDASAVEPLTILLNNDRAAADAAWILGKIGDARAIEPLIASLSRIPVIAAEAIGKIGDARAIYPLTDYLKNDKNDRKAREAVLEALRKIRDPRAIKPLLNLTADRYWSEKVIELFGEILEHNATDTPLDSLSAIINLNRVMKADYKWVESTWGELPPGQDGHLEEIAPVQVDCSKIKFLAQQEMSRRKLTT